MTIKLQSQFNKAYVKIRIQIVYVATSYVSNLQFNVDVPAKDGFILFICAVTAEWQVSFAMFYKFVFLFSISEQAGRCISGLRLAGGSVAQGERFLQTFKRFGV